MTKKEHRECLFTITKVLRADPYIMANYASEILGLATIAHDLRNRPPVARGQVTAKTITPQKAQEIRDLHKAHPDWNYTQIANVAGVQIGRVSEQLAGIRT